jgi:hypothetical protein
VHRLPESASEPRRTRGGAGSAARAETTLPPWHSQKVKVSKRVWGEGRYSPGAVAWHVQITALQQRPERCRASVATLARYMGDSKRTGERYLRELGTPGPDGVAELTTIRHTDSAGDGETGERFTRALERGEHFALVPVAAAKSLRHALFVLYCALTYAVATRTPVTAAELAGVLGVTEMTARRMTGELERAGWITVHRRGGTHGRHAYEVHDHPLHPVAAEPEAVSSDGGSGASADGGSLAIKEDAGLTDSRTTQPGGAFRRRRDDRKWVGSPVDTGGNAPVVPPALRGRVRPSAPPAYAGPQLTLSPRVWAVLAPVADLLPGCTDFAVRRIAREVGRQLDDGIWPEEIRDQLDRLRRWTPTEDIRDPGRWLLGAVLPVRSRCNRPGCHWGFLAHTGMPCKACAELQSGDSDPPDTDGPRPRPYACGSCGWASPAPLPYDRCAACRPA